MVPDLASCLAQQVPVAFLRSTLKTYINNDQDRVLSALNDAQCPPAYVTAVLRTLIQVSESNDVPVSETIAEAYANQLVMPHSSASDDEPTVVRYKLYTPPECPIVASSTVLLREKPNILVSEGSTGHRTWEAALALADYILRHDNSKAPSQVVELGAGTGLVGLVSATKYSSQVIVTDGDDQVVSCLKGNINLNSWAQPLVKAQPLVWGTDHAIVHHDQIVVCADVTYDDYIIPYLVSCLRDFLKTGSRYCLLSATVRDESTLNIFLGCCHDNRLKAELQLTYSDPFDCQFFIPPHSPDIRIYRLSIDNSN
uniref:ARAD1D01936p n=1 Tax=Blastobotrys adeninivorans TaxID=409370 RepID=A0A060TCS6_BLAAD